MWAECADITLRGGSSPARTHRHALLCRSHLLRCSQLCLIWQHVLILPSTINWRSRAPALPWQQPHCRPGLDEWMGSGGDRGPGLMCSGEPACLTCITFNAVHALAALLLPQSTSSQQPSHLPNSWPHTAAHSACSRSPQPSPTCHCITMHRAVEGCLPTDQHMASASSQVPPNADCALMEHPAAHAQHALHSQACPVAR